MHFKTFSALILKTHYLKGTVIVNLWHYKNNKSIQQEA